MLSVVWPTATNALSEITPVDAFLLDMILKAQAGVLKLVERRPKLTGLDAPEKVQEVGPVSDAKATLPRILDVVIFVGWFVHLSPCFQATYLQQNYATEKPNYINGMRFVSNILIFASSEIA
jgi:hypothetical protein